jgi:hypothetical protein
VDPNARSLVIAFKTKGVTAYTDTGTAMWTSPVVAEDVLAYEHGAVIVSLGEGVLAWLDAKSGAELGRWKAHLVDCQLRAAVHPAGDRLVTSSCDEAVRVWKF